MPYLPLWCSSFGELWFLGGALGLVVVGLVVVGLGALGLGALGR